MIVELTDNDFDIKTRGGIVVVLIYSELQHKAPEGLLSLAVNHHYSDEVKFMMIDADRYPGILGRLGITGLPATLFLRNGIKKNLMQKVSDPREILVATEENACYRCSITRNRAKTRKNSRHRF